MQVVYFTLYRWGGQFIMARITLWYRVFSQFHTPKFKKKSAYILLEYSKKQAAFVGGTRSKIHERW